jgi:hypothetical protein
MADWTKFLEATALLAWPLIVGFLLWRLFPLVKTVASSRNFTVKFGNVEVSAQDATDKIQAQLNDLNEKVQTLRSSVIVAPETSPAPPVDGPLRLATLLWVDDKPDGNALEVAQLRERGIESVQVRSTSEAMDALENRTDFCAVISDMGRTEDGAYRPKAGIELCRAILAGGYTYPFFVYTGRRSAITHNATVKSEGGCGATASTIELFEWIDSQIGRKA